MPTTSNFGWTTPADTDLVKDGAAAIRTLGNGIDTSLIDLKGGTTGQYLIKQSNTDLDFTWTTNTADIDGVTATSPLTGGGTSGTITVGIQDATTAQKGAVQLEDSTSSTSTTKAATPNSVKTSYDLANAAIPKSLVDAKADLITATADNTPARLAVGSNFAFLTADSAQSTGLLWDISSFTSYTPTISAGGGTFTSASVVGKYKRIGKICIVKIAATITTAGTGTGTVTVTLPFTSVSDGNTYAAGSFRENQVTGITGVGRVSSNSSNCNISRYDDTSFIADNRLIVGTVIYEVA